MTDSWSSSLDETQTLYDHAAFLVQQATNNQRFVLICGDFNASVGNIIPNEDATPVGDVGIGPRTARGASLISFVQGNCLLICNSLFERDLATAYRFFTRQLDCSTLIL